MKEGEFNLMDAGVEIQILADMPLREVKGRRDDMISGITGTANGERDDLGRFGIFELCSELRMKGKHCSGWIPRTGRIDSTGKTVTGFDLWMIEIRQDDVVATETTVMNMGLPFGKRSRGLAEFFEINFGRGFKSNIFGRGNLGSFP